MSERASLSQPRQDWSAGTYARHARFVSDLAEGVVSWLAPQPGERILDLGCGDGALTEKLCHSGASLVGVDSSADLLAAAKARGLDARLMDGERLTFDSEFDAVFSNAALHWMKAADKVAEGVSRALKPGGRFVAEFGGHGNVAAIVTAMLAVARHRGGDGA
ncbi:MAG: class I SAM-dependent methyltransferase, partial [Alphaproteobacteria bacterium]|nr:class I SAM-dependent methyltransferase [Alphaproteobacteria bacterium]